ncbi:MAG: sigma 54-dependent Fis family transcriptional regulator [Myxococcales bacterium]|nr:sigma 54-dependent Fis family transcriptional regulator [Myxococcales bacterium]MCB9583385.1 sigma 54-dependent Fis family transcriptional regulator [Polyangiaceae bacterium]
MSLGGSGVRAKLVVLDGPDEGLERALDDKLVVGADAAADLVLSDETVSRKHAEFSIENGRVHVRDLGSRNGTFLGSARVVEAEVTLGSVLRLGATPIGVHPRWHVREVQPGQHRQFGELLGESVAMRELFAMLERIAPTDVTVLVEGESGTGKELVARSIHGGSERSGAPFIVFDCGAVPVNLAESELFGHKRGAFSGAISDRAGAFQQAHGGTIFLDEIGELPLDLQPRLLRVLETGQVRRVGDDTMRRVDVRVVAATNRDLHAEVRRGNFRGDLLYRLDVVKLRIPPLRQRPEDIRPLAQAMLQGRITDGDELAGENLRRLLGYSWPGNVRELRNVLDRAVALASKKPPAFADLVFNLGPAADSPALLGMAFPGVHYPLPFKEAKLQLLASFERAYIDALIDRHKGNMSQAAEAAGLSRKHLYELLRKVRGEDPEE